MLIGYTTAHSLHARVHYAEGVLTLALSGCMTPHSFQRVAAYAAIQASTQPWTVVVYDMSRSVALFDHDQPIASALTRIGRPGCYLATEDMCEPLQKACWLLGRIGVERRVFTSSDEALSWARLRALQVAAQSERALARVRIARAEEAVAQLEQVAQAR